MQDLYIDSVKKRLKEFMGHIKEIMVKSSVFLHALMNILIKQFCNLINDIFLLIKAKLIYYLAAVYATIVVDYVLLLKDVEEFNKKLLELKSLVDKYKSILDKVKGLLTKLKTLLSNAPILKILLSVISPLNQIVSSLLNKLKSVCSFCNKVNGLYALLNKELTSLSVELQGSSIIIKSTIKDKSEGKKIASIKKIEPSKITDFKNSTESLKNILGISELSDIMPSNKMLRIVEQLLTMETINRSKGGVTVSPLKFNLKLIVDFPKYLESIKKLLGMMEMFRLPVSEQIKSIKEYLDVLEPINLVKLYALITNIQLKYDVILIRIELLVCTIKFHKEITTEANKLFALMKFDCSNVSQFLTRCSKVEKNGQCILDKIDDCIKKLREACKDSECSGVPPELLKLYSKVIGIIGWLKFYVDLMAMEILIFKMIILTLIEMSVSSAILEGLIKGISENITDIDKAIATLVGVNEYLKAFHFIQLQNSMAIFVLSSKLKFSEFINQYYGVLVINLYWINWLIWVIECYIHHLLVFRQVSKDLNSLINDIGDQFMIITEINNVVKSMFTITNKLISIKSSIAQLNNIQDSMDITNWKEKAQKIRHETESVSRDVSEIDSQISEINKNGESIFSSFAKLIEIYYSLLLLISYVSKEVEKTNKDKILGTGLGNEYYKGVIVSVIEPCNKQLKFILAYLFDMWLYTANLIKVVETTIALIYEEMLWLKLLTDDIKSNVHDIDIGVEGMECEIEGVPRNLIRCSLLSTNNSMYSNFTSLGVSQLDKQVVSMYSVTGVTSYNSLINGMSEFWTFSDESVYVYGYVLLCSCTSDFKSKYRSEEPSSFPYSFPRITTKDINPVSELLRNTMAENVGNHLCLCLVIKYHLRPSLLKCILILRNEDLGTLDIISRKFQNYNSWMGLKSDLWKLCGLVVTIIYKITSFLRNKYNFVPIRSFYPSEMKCFCSISNKIDYHLITNTILFLSSLIENMWTMDPESTSAAIRCLSSLLSEYQSIHVYTHYGSQNIIIPFQIPQTFKLNFEEMEIICFQSSSLFYFYSIDMNYTISLFGDIFSIFLKFDILGFLDVSKWKLFAGSFFSFFFKFNDIIRMITKSYNIIKLTFEFIVSKFLLYVGSVKLKKTSSSECDKVSTKKIVMIISLKLLNDKIDLVQKDIYNKMRIDSLIIELKKGKEKLNDLNKMTIEYITWYLITTKNNLLNSHQPHLNHLSSYENVKDISASNWGYDTRYELHLTGSNSITNGDNHALVFKGIV